MPVTLHEFIHAAGHGDGDVAGYLRPSDRSPDDPHRFVYWRSSNAMLPAFVNCLEDGGDMRRVYTSHERAPWVRPRGPGVKRRDNLRPDAGDGSLPIEPVPMTTRRWPARVAGPAGPAPLAGGLHAAALAAARGAGTGAVGTGSVGTGGGDGGDRASELIRSLRHYALATRTLIESSARSGFAGLHDHVGALLVSDAGAILAAGINTGSYRHAEVSLLLSWFRDHPRARTLPARSVVFTTLTPCRQCTRYLSLAMAPDTLVLFDEADTGRAGRVGERIAERLDAGGDAGGDAGEGGGIGPGSEADRRPPGDVARESASAGAASARNATSRGMHAVREAERRARRNGGEGGLSRIDRAREARRAILEGADAVGRTAVGRTAIGGTGGTADGERGTADPGRTAEAAVLAYLARWIRGAALVE